jgi:hypothetical protein
MRKAVLDEDNRVIDIRKVEEGETGYLEAPPTLSIGCFYDPVNQVFLPPPPPPTMPEPVPYTISRFQARQRLFQMGLLDDAEALVLAQGTEAAMAWEDVYEFRRDSQLVNGVAPQLGMDQDDLDDFFRLAATITI